MEVALDAHGPTVGVPSMGSLVRPLHNGPNGMWGRGGGCPATGQSVSAHEQVLRGLSFSAVTRSWVAGIPDGLDFEITRVREALHG